MKKNTSIFLSLILIFIASYFLYCKGEQALEKSAEKFTVLAFENTDLNCNSQSLAFFVENNLKEENSYQISINNNDEIFENLKVSVSPQSKKSIQPQAKTIEKLCNLSQKIKYQISVKNEANQKIIYKLITPKND